MPYIVTRFPRDEIVKIEIRSAFERMQKNQYVIIDYRFCVNFWIFSCADLISINV